MNTPDAANRTATTRRSHWARRSHRILGIGSMVFLIMISLSGLILNHADALGLSRHAAGPVFLSIYGIEAPPVDAAFAAGDVIFATSSGSLFADGIELAANSTQLSGAIEFDDSLVVATSNEFFVMTIDANLIERFVAEVSNSITRLGTDGQRIIVSLQDEMFAFDAVQMSLSPVGTDAADDVIWSKPAVLSSDQAEEIGIAGLANTMNWERILIDFHSGRILPTIGRYIADITALCLLYLCISGIVLWTRRR